jgi:enamine deaminase RidA (YjgF/YER057c/UK114 family)
LLFRPQTVILRPNTHFEETSTASQRPALRWPLAGGRDGEERMKTGRRQVAAAEVRFAFLDDHNGRMAEFWYGITPAAYLRLPEQIAAISEAEETLLREFSIPAAQIVSKRFFSSDLHLHGEALRRQKVRQGEEYFCSVVEQPPANGARLALLGLCLGSVQTKRRSGPCFVVESDFGVRHFFVEHLAVDDAQADAEAQTSRIFQELARLLAREDATIADHVLRTWIYAPHLDADYPGIVRARNAVFSAIGLVPESHFIASTGIQGGAGLRFARVLMDVYAMSGSGRGRTRYIHVPDFMPPTHTYGVAFERATAVAVGPLEFLFISGTASIDKHGQILHEGDVERQTERTLENLAAVLDAADFARGDLTSLIVYLRDPADHAFVQPRVRAFAGDVPAIYVKAAVCRPGWLVEIEATAARHCARHGGLAAEERLR